VGLRGASARAGAFTYDDEVRFFLLPVTRKVQPRFESLDGPPRLVIELPGVAVPEPATRTYPGALVHQAELTQGDGGAARVVLTTSRPLDKHYAWRWSGNNMVVIFDHKPAQLAPAVAVSPSAPGALAGPLSAASPAQPSGPRATPTQRPAPTPRPSRPSARPAGQSNAPSSRPLPTPATAATRAGFSFTGTIFNINSGEPLGGVRVTVGGRAVVTDRDGRFQLVGLTRGEHRVAVSLKGFAAQSFPILVPEDKSISVNLVPSL
jgi:hypothetical protein